MPYLPPQVLQAERDDTIRNLTDRCVIMVQSLHPIQQIYTTPYRIGLSGIPADLAPAGYEGSGVPVDVWDVKSLPDQDYLSLADHLSIGPQQFRVITLPWFVNDVLSGFGGLRIDSRIVVGGSLSGVGSGAGWLGGKVYQVAALADDVTDPTEVVCHCRSLNEP